MKNKNGNENKQMNAKTYINNNETLLYCRSYRSMLYELLWQSLILFLFCEVCLLF